MQQFKIVLPDAAYQMAESEAKILGIDVSTYCANLLTDCLVRTHRPSTHTTPERFGSVAQASSPSTVANLAGAATDAAPANLMRPDFASIFSTYPEKSRRYAEAIYDEATKICGVTAKFDARKGHKSVMFEPNFLVVEYLLSKGTRAGIEISLGANKSRYRNAPTEIKDGRTESYSRILIETDEVLRKSLPLVSETYNLRYKP